MEKVNIDEVIIKVLYTMQTVVEQQQLDTLKATLYMNFGKYQLFEEETALTTTLDDNNYIINLFLATLKIEGRTDKTIGAYTTEYRTFFSFIDKNVRDVTTNDIRMYLAHCKTVRKNCDVTLNNHIRNLRSLFKWLTAEDYIDKDPLRKINQIKTESKIKDVITDEQAEVIRCSCDRERDIAIIDLLSSTGMRVGELVLINRSDIDFANGECIVYGKGRKERVVYINGRAKVHLKNYLDSRTDDNEALFVSCRKPHDRLSDAGIRNIVKKVKTNTQIENLHIHPHKFRRTMATNMINKGARAEDVQQILGHASVETTLRCYAKISNNVVKDAHRRYAV